MYRERQPLSIDLSVSGTSGLTDVVLINTSVRSALWALLRWQTAMRVGAKCICRPVMRESASPTTGEADRRPDQTVYSFTLGGLTILSPRSRASGSSCCQVSFLRALSKPGQAWSDSHFRPKLDQFYRLKATASGALASWGRLILRQPAALGLQPGTAASIEAGGISSSAETS